MGDFNETRDLSERTGCLDNMRRRCDEDGWMNDIGMIDLGFLGQRYTWNRGTEVNRSSAQLDRGMCNSEWRNRFPNASIRHLAAN
ncbi:LOW QUALITY PROTEIN: hypothetical protein V2J09_021096 [Rumex salicifolius]